jgi:hypothetical protein
VALLALYKARLRALRVPEETISERIGSSLQQWGKPTAATYRFVEERLRSLAPPDGGPPAGPGTKWCFYMVGDNPTSDMEGVRRANIHHAQSSTEWKGVLVRTGVYKEGDETNGATSSSTASSRRSTGSSSRKAARSRHPPRRREPESLRMHPHPAPAPTDEKPPGARDRPGHPPPSYCCEGHTGPLR